MNGFLRLLAIFCILLSPAAAAAEAPENFSNPILPGYHPDPSIVRVGEDYYMVNSTFEWFPGMPVHHSKDLVNWELIGYGLHRESQASGAVNLVDVQSNGGIHAPTIRCGDGRFYIITTNVYLPPEPGAHAMKARASRSPGAVTPEASVPKPTLGNERGRHRY